MELGQVIVGISGIFIFIIAILSSKIIKYVNIINKQTILLKEVNNKHNFENNVSKLGYNIDVIRRILQEGTFAIHDNKPYRNYNSNGNRFFIRKRTEGKKKIVPATGLYYKYTHTYSDFFISSTDLLHILKTSDLSNINIESKIMREAVLELPIVSNGQTI